MIATTRAPDPGGRNAPSCCSALVVSADFDTTTAFPAAAGLAVSLTSTPPAPLRSASSTKAAPSNRSPRIATKKSPGASVRESIETRPIGVAASPETSRPAAAVARIPAVSDTGGHCRHETREPRALRERRARDLNVVERQRPLADHLVFLVPFSGNEHEIAGACLADGVLDRQLAVHDRHADRRLRPWPLAPARSGGSTMPRLMSSMICSGFSDRGLSEVTTTRSLRRAATAPISGRFVLSRSPPQPNTVITRPEASGRAVSRRFFSASSVCA